MSKIPFNKPSMTGKELWYISQAHHNTQLSGDGPFTKQCHELLQKLTSAKKVLLTHSCTAALEMSATLANIQPGDEVIMPSYTFVSTANAFVLRGAIPIFVDIRPDTLNLNEKLIEEEITSKTKAIVPVHYAGVACEMDEIIDIAHRYNLLVIEDAAQGIRSFYRNKALGSIGHLGTFSFHETKNITSGEGGALLINDDSFSERAEIIREKGTNRSKFIRGHVDKYTWVDIGSSYLPGEIVAAFLYAQLEEVDTITENRLSIWNKYHKGLKPLEDIGYLRRPIVPEHCKHNAHMYYILLNSKEKRDTAIDYLRSKGIISVFHYIPLHNSPAGLKYAKVRSSMEITDKLSGCLLRLPLFVEMTDENIERVLKAIREVCEFAK
ncbi:MAG: dTDP-4-amino-4,6-dideoxygalactose transaminase [Leptospiraceae bacterium]|nr:dTDP-4-amino-4,6-dideoxygalactose transaminase [Leptospiraceae bacterium]